MFWQRLYQRWLSIYHPKYVTMLAIAIIGLAAMAGGAYATYQAYFEQSPYSYLPTDTNWKQHIQSLVDLARQNVTKAASVASSSATVAVTGAVSRPGVYSITNGSRWQDAVLAAGGFTSGASQRFIHQDLNLAMVARDGEKLYVPLATEDTGRVTTPISGPETTRQGSITTATKDWLTFFNSATATELDSLPGIGAARAQTIINTRPFTQLAEIAEKTKINAALLEAIWNDNDNNNE
jgi:DNA uptake protein ComE-like DNA-binding protein